MKRECLSFLKLDRSQTCLAFSFLSSRVAPTRQSHFNRDFACRFKGLNKVNYKLHLFPKYYPVKYVIFVVWLVLRWAAIDAMAGDQLVLIAWLYILR